MAGLALADGGGPDYIDQLPDHLMHRIFSFLPTKDVVRFCSLSRRWLRCCTDVLNVDFHESLHTSRELHRFVSFVNGYIRRYSSDKMERFSLRLDRPCDRIQASIDPWIQFAVSHRVKELSLDLESYELPWFVSSSTWLETLRITHCTIPNQCDGFNWFHLKELSISQMQLSDNMLRSIFLGTPALELLKLEGSRGLNTIDLRRPPRLRELVVDSNEGSRRLEIIAPSLRVLRLRGCWQCQELKLTDVSSVAEAELDFLLQVTVDRDDDFYIRPPQFFCNTFKGILDQLQQASVLRIGYWCNEVVALVSTVFPLQSSEHYSRINFRFKLCLRSHQVVSSMEEAGVDIRKMTNVKHLMIDSMLDRVDLIGISTLLERSPHVEKLQLRRLGSDIDYEVID